jgi:hypothetical protein
LIKDDAAPLSVNSVLGAILKVQQLDSLDAEKAYNLSREFETKYDFFCKKI